MRIRNFRPIDLPIQWREYYTKYPHGMTIFESLVQWVNSVNDMVENINDLNHYMNDFINQWQGEMKEEVINTLTEWKESGFLENILITVFGDALEDMDLRIDGVENIIEETDNKLKEVFINIVKDLDVDNTGAQDVTAQFIQALQYCENNNNKLIIPEGVYTLSEHIFDESGVIYKNEGTYPGSNVFTVRENPFSPTDLDKEILHTITKKSGTYSTLQGGCVVGNYLYLALVDGSRPPGGLGVILKLNRHTGQEIDSKEVVIHHGNSIAYNHKDGNLYIAYSDDEGGRHKGAIVNPDTLVKVGEYSLGNSSRRHNAIAIDSKNDLIICTSNHVEKLYWIFDMEWNLLKEYHMEGDTFMYYQDNEILDGLLLKTTGASQSYGENIIHLYDYVGNKVDEYRLWDPGDGQESQEIQFITQTTGSEMIVGYNNTNGDYVLYTIDLMAKSKKDKALKSLFYAKGKIMRWETQLGLVSLIPALDYAQEKLPGVTSRIGNGSVDLVGSPDLNDIRYSGFYYYTASASNKPTSASSNGYLIVLASLRGHCTQLAFTTGPGSLWLYMRKYIADGTGWSDWARSGFDSF